MIGNTLSHYKIIEKLGQGGQGEVYLAEDSRLDRKVALKILPQHLSDRAELRERFEREARAVSSLNHPHICTLYDIGEQDGIHYLVMQYLEGETLKHLLEIHFLREDPSSRRQVRRFPSKKGNRLSSLSYVESHSCPRKFAKLPRI